MVHDKQIPVVFGVKGTKLESDEINLFKNCHPTGYILFRRNIESIEQLKILISELKTLNENEIDIYIDQEGGRVARLKPPMFMECPAPQSFVVDKENLEQYNESLQKTYDHYFKLTKALLEIGINVNCTPVVDILFKDADKISMGDRCFSSNPETVIDYAKEVMRAITEAGGRYVMKHIPGHGRSKLDSHFHLPIVENKVEELAKSDFYIFRELTIYAKELATKHNAALPMAMTAHIIYKDIDENNPATLSRPVINYIREEIQFSGTLITDDINMQALKTNLDNIADIAKKSIEAGCDIVLHCSGIIGEMNIIAETFCTI